MNPYINLTNDNIAMVFLGSSWRSNSNNLSLPLVVELVLTRLYAVQGPILFKLIKGRLLKIETCESPIAIKRSLDKEASISLISNSQYPFSKGITRPDWKVSFI